MKLASWMSEVSDVCPDEGLEAYSTFDEGSKILPRMVIWIGILLGFEQATQAIVTAIAFKVPLRLRMQTLPKFELPIALVLLWVLFTSLSIAMVGLTFRSAAAILVKTLHVATETLFLVSLLFAFGFPFVAASAIVFVVCVASMVITLPCQNMVGYAATGGLVLDSVNFLSLAWYGIASPDDVVLWTLIGGFGWHALYLLSYLVIKRWHVGVITLVWVRIFGMVCNLIASEFLLHAARLALPKVDVLGGWMTKAAWLCASEDQAILWAQGRPWLRDAHPPDKRKRNTPTDAATQITMHAPGSSAYAEADLWRAWRAFALPGVGLLRKRSARDAELAQAVLCSPLGKPQLIENARNAPVDDVYVVHPSIGRVISRAVLVVVGIGIGTIA